MRSCFDLCPWSKMFFVIFLILYFLWFFFYDELRVASPFRALKFPLRQRPKTTWDSTCARAFAPERVGGSKPVEEIDDFLYSYSCALNINSPVVLGTMLKQSMERLKSDPRAVPTHNSWVPGPKLPLRTPCALLVRLDLNPSALFSLMSDWEVVVCVLASETFQRWNDADKNAKWTDFVSFTHLIFSASWRLNQNRSDPHVHTVAENSFS